MENGKGKTSFLMALCDLWAFFGRSPAVRAHYSLKSQSFHFILRLYSIFPSY